MALNNDNSNWTKFIPDGIRYILMLTIAIIGFFIVRTLNSIESQIMLNSHEINKLKETRYTQEDAQKDNTLVLKELEIMSLKMEVLKEKINNIGGNKVVN